MMDDENDLYQPTVDKIFHEKETTEPRCEQCGKLLRGNDIRFGLCGGCRAHDDL